MTKILIVDDEKIERNGIKFLLKQLGISAEVVEAVNGLKALEVLEKEKIDILLTDIKMPFMDGLSLIQNVVEKYPKLKIIIFSGYGEFEYAKKAMFYNVNNYILKPVDPKEFEITLKKVMKEIEDENLMLEAKEESEQFVREHILLSLINGTKREDLQGKSQKVIPLDFVDSFCSMMLLEFNNDFFGTNGAQFYSDIIEKGDFDCQYLNISPDQSVVLFTDDETDKKKIADYIVEKVKELYGDECYIAISEKFEDGRSLSYYYDELENLMENKFYVMDERVFESDTSNMSDELGAIQDDLLMKQISQDIHMKDAARLKEHFTKLCDKYKGKKAFSQIYVKFIFSNLMKDIYDILPDVEKNDFNMAIDELYRAVDFNEVMNILKKRIDKLENAFGANPQMIHREIETVKEYIYNNYDKELSVDMLAEQVFMAPSYLSFIFKKETGQNISKFIKALRMEKAKDMLINSHKKIVNISYDVGYSNVSYFCQSFREYYGVSPQKYRKEGSVH